MSRTLTAADRSALIRLASSLPEGSEERRAILEGFFAPLPKGKKADQERLEKRAMSEQEDTARLEELAGGSRGAFKMLDIWKKVQNLGTRYDKAMDPDRYDPVRNFVQRARREGFSNEAIRFYVENIQGHSLPRNWKRASQDKEARSSLSTKMFTSVVDTRGLDKVKQNLRKAGDDQSYKLLMECVRYFLNRFDLSSDEEQAINRMAGLASRGADWDPSLVRNNVFKIANSLGMKLPSGIF